MTRSATLALVLLACSDCKGGASKTEAPGGAERPNAAKDAASKPEAGPVSTAEFGDADWRPEGWEDGLVYDLGFGYPGTVAVDEDSLYWSDRSVLMRAPKDGLGTPRHFDQWDGTLLGPRIRTDGTWICWDDNRTVICKTKDESRREVLTFEGWVPNDVSFSATHIYIGMVGCSGIARVHKESLDQEIVDTGIRYDPERGSSGNNYLIRSGNALYCGAWHTLLRWAEWGARMEVLVDSADQVRAMTLYDSTVYYMHRARSVNARVDELWAVTNGRPELVFEPELTVSVGLFPDASRDRLIYMSSSPLAIYPTRKTMHLLARGQASGEAAADGQYVYWPHYENARYGAIKRVAIDTEGTPFP